MGFGQFDEEGGLGCEDIVVGAEARHDAVDGGEAGGAGGDVAADLGHDDGDAGLAEDGRFAGGVGSCEEGDVGFIAAEVDVVGDELFDVGEAWMAELGEFEDASVSGAILGKEDRAAGGSTKGRGCLCKRHEAV